MALASGDALRGRGEPEALPGPAASARPLHWHHSQLQADSTATVTGIPAMIWQSRRDRDGGRGSLQGMLSVNFTGACSPAADSNDAEPEPSLK